MTQPLPLCMLSLSPTPFTPHHQPRILWLEPMHCQFDSPWPPITSPAFFGLSASSVMAMRSSLRAWGDGGVKYSPGPGGGKVGGRGGTGAFLALSLRLPPSLLAGCQGPVLRVLCVLHVLCTLGCPPGRQEAPRGALPRPPWLAGSGTKDVLSACAACPPCPYDPCSPCGSCADGGVASLHCL